jgi:glycosyltransferase involved in cell wall biosynthesis
MKIIYAINVHSGGGKTLLDELINGIDKPGEYCLFLNERYKLKADPSQFSGILVFKNNLLSRLLAELKLFFIQSTKNKVLYFGNLPPLIKPSGFISVYLQNRYLIDFVVLDGFSWKTKIRIWLERAIFFIQSRNVDQFFVQTRTMKNLLITHIGNSKPVKILPFSQLKNTRESDFSRGNIASDKFSSFVYPASGEPHKNHVNLIAAWIELANDGIFPKLYLTLDELLFPDLVTWISEKIQFHRLNIVNMGILDTHGLHVLYDQVDALIFTSYFESFGLPLLEAKTFGLPILAPELDFVRDIVSPIETFDPMSKVSISRAVMRFMGNVVLSEKIRSGKEFIDEVFN